MNFERGSDFLTSIKGIEDFLRQRKPRYMREESKRDYAVLLPLVPAGGKTGILFEKRAGSLRSQPGEICFPGGAIEPGESPRQAVIREAEEELLISRKNIGITAELDILSTPVGVTIYPFLGHLGEYQNTFSKAEVERVFSVPLEWFLKNEPERHKTRVITVPGEDFPYELVPGGRDYRWREGVYEVLFYRWKEQIIWGMTAKILHAFVELYRLFLKMEEN